MSWTSLLQTAANRREKTEAITRLAAANSLQRNLQREDRLAYETQKKAFQKTWGEAVPEEDETVNNIDSPTTTTVNHNGAGKLATAAAIATGMAIPVAGIGGYAIGQALNTAPEVIERVQETSQDVDIGLGRIEDYQR
jgi:hypothetical protein